MNPPARHRAKCARLIEAGADPVGSMPEVYTAFIKSEIVKWANVIKAAGIKGE